MFRRLPDDGSPGPRPFAWVFDGRALIGHAGETVAAALLRHNVMAIRHHAVDGSPRLPYCMMGQCQECLVTVDGGAAQRACLLALREGMRVCSTGTAPSSP